MTKTISKLILAGICAGVLTVRARAEDKPSADAPAAKSTADDNKAVEKYEASKGIGKNQELPKVDLNAELAPKFKEFDPEKSSAPALSESEVDHRMHFAIHRLTTSGWREAEADIVSMGKPAVPYLIDALAAPAEGSVPVAFNLGSHTKADSSRGTHSRTLGEVCAEVLTEMVTNHSDFKGDIPYLDQKAWQDWWTANGSKVNFGT